MAEDLDDRSKDLVVDVILLALSRCTRGHVGLSFRGSLRGEKKIFERGIDLEPVWSLLSVLEGLDVESSKPAFHYLKSLESRLGVTVKLPGSLRKDADAPAPALLKKEELDRFLAAASAREVTPAGSRSLPILSRRATPLPGSRTPTQPPTPKRPPTEPPATRSKTPLPAPVPASRTKIALAVGGMVVALACIWFIARPAVSTNVEWKSFAPADLSTEIPISQARALGHEVHADLADPSWLQSPEEARTRQLVQALELAKLKDATVIVVKEAGKVRATAQWFGDPPKPRIRWYLR